LRVDRVERAARAALATRVERVDRVDRVERWTSASAPSACLTRFNSNSGVILFGISIPSWD
jgi:hypothetical protein